MSNSDEEYTIPLQDQRAFGAGLKRKRVQFVRSSETTTSASNSTTSYGHRVSKTYLGLVLPQSQPPDNLEKQNLKTDIGSTETEPQICETCSLPIPPIPSSTPHAALLAHQLSLPHSHPPSSLSRHRTGVRMLRDQGWDPDARTGLGAHGEGIRYPIKAKEKNDKLGIGATMPKPKPDVLELSRGVGGAKFEQEKENKKGKVKKKGWVKKTADEEKRRSDRLQQLFYESEEVSKYLR